MSKTIGFGILGAGLIAPFHGKAVKAAKGGKLVTVCDIDKARADKRAGELGVKATYSLDEMLANPEVQAVNVTTPNHLHFDAVMKCFAAGKHVLTEKPPALSLKEIDAMVAAARKANLKFGCTVQCRVRKSIQAVKRAIDQGRFGKVLQADTAMKWFRPAEYYKSDAWRGVRKFGAGVTVQHAFHYIDLLTYLAGPVAQVDAKMVNLAHPAETLEDTLFAFLKYGSGAYGVVEASTGMWPGTDVRIEVNGENGTAIVAGERMVTWKFRDERPEDAEIRTYGDAAQVTGAGGAADLGFADHQIVIQDLIDAIGTDRDLVIPVAAVRHTVEIVLAMYASADAGKPVDFPFADGEHLMH